MICHPSWRRNLCALLSCAVFAGCSEPQQVASPSPPKVNVGRPVERELVDEEEFNGWLESSAVVELRARVRGHIHKVNFSDGQLVDAGQPLFELDPRPFQLAIDQSKAQGDALVAQKVVAEKDVARYTELIKTGGATRQQLDKAQADADAYDAQIAAKQQEVRQHELDLEFARITAPIAGRISRALLTEGDLVNAGGTDPMLTTIVAIDPIRVYFSVDERTLQRFMRDRPKEEPTSRGLLRDRNLPFKFALDLDQGFPRSGVLDFADNRVDSTTGTYQIRGEVENKDGALVPGSRVRVRVPVSQTYQAVVVPDTAILSDQDKRYVLVLDEKNVVARRDVVQGRLLDDGMRVVLPPSTGGAPVTPEDRIVVLGLQKARINYPVAPVETSSAPAGEQSSSR